MRMVDFGVSVVPPKARTGRRRRARARPGSGFPDPRRLNQRLGPISEAVRWELAGERVDAPFGKLVINLYDPDAGGPVEANPQNADPSDPAPIVLIDVAFAGAALPATAVAAERAAFTSRVIEACRPAVAALGQLTGWSPAGMLAVLDRVAASDPPFHHLWGTKTLPGRRGRVELWYDITDTHTTLTVRQLGPTGDVVRDEVVASIAMPAALDWWMPLHSFVLEDGGVLQRDKARQPVAIHAGFQKHGATVRPRVPLPPLPGRPR